MLFFAFGTFWFWVMLAAFLITEIALTKKEDVFWLTAVFVAFLITSQFFSDLQPLSWVAHHPLWTLAGFLAYFPAGLPYVRWKWQIKCRRRREKSEEFFAEYSKNMVRKIGSSEYVEGYRNFAAREGWSIVGDPLQPPQWKNYKNWFAATLVYWVFDLAWACTHDLISNIVTSLYRYVAKTFQADADRIYQGFSPVSSEAKPNREEEL